jgi:large subunit ribosomal protein L6
MSRIGKKAIAVPKGVTVNVNGQSISAKGPKGELNFVVSDLCTIALENDEVFVKPINNSKPARSHWGMSRTRISNMIDGVANEFTKTLELVGVGYRAQMKGSALSLALGFSHDIDYPAPDGVKIATPKQTEIVLTGIDKQKVGQAAAEIRSFRPPEPYKGKGVKYAGEFIFRKEGKKK